MSSVRILAAGLGAGLPLPRALALSALDDETERDTVTDILEFSRHTGAERVAVLTALADSREESIRRERTIDTASAATRQTTRILLALPAATALGAELFGFAVFEVLFGSPVGWLCIVFGVILNVMAVRWMASIRASIPRPPRNIGLVLELAAAVAVSSGLTNRHLDQLALRATAWETDVEFRAIGKYRALSRETGVPVSGLLTMEAGQVRATARADVELAVELLPGRLLGPVGACLFPAFIVTTVVPVVASMVGKLSS